MNWASFFLGFLHAGYRNVWKGIKDFVQSGENKEWDKFVEEYTKALREQEF